jgi:hypothetical protein
MNTENISGFVPTGKGPEPENPDEYLEREGKVPPGGWQEPKTPPAGTEGEN